MNCSAHPPETCLVRGSKSTAAHPPGALRGNAPDLPAHLAAHPRALHLARSSAGVSGPLGPRTSRTMSPRRTESMMTVLRATEGTAGLSCVSATVAIRTNAIAPP